MTAATAASATAPASPAAAQPLAARLRTADGLALACDKWPARNGAPLFLMGHSMGGAIAALYAIERAPARARALNSDPGQHAQMRDDAAPERGQVVAALETADDAALSMTARDIDDLRGQPFEVGLDEP